jgi:protoporphyrin/coproporphyrin ferrochelatase
MKTAVVLFNLGGPSKQEDIKPFLYNFFMDKNIIAAPLPVRWMIANWIAFSRGRGAAKDSYALLGYKSPLLENTKAQAHALQAALGGDHKVFTCMRYWHPMAGEVAQQVKEYAPDTIVLLPLYPQFSTTTSFSSFESWHRAAKKAGLSAPAREICCYPLDAGFIKASAGNINAAMQNAPANTRLLFSAHGLPKKIIDAGDPYQWQCEQSAAAIAAETGIKNLDWQICYQSRVGPLEWIGPSTETALAQAAKDGKGVVIYPHAFVSEHVETLVEIELEYREKAHHLGIPHFIRVETVGIRDAFIKGLAALVTGSAATRICPEKFCKCGKAKTCSK